MYVGQGHRKKESRRSLKPSSLPYPWELLLLAIHTNFRMYVEDRKRKRERERERERAFIAWKWYIPLKSDEPFM